MMKTIAWIVTSVLMIAIIAPTKAGNPMWEKIIKAPQLEKYEGETQATTTSSVVMAGAFNNMAASSAPAAFDKCRKYKSKQIAGWVLMPVGLGMIGGGVYMMYSGARNIANSVDVGFSGVSASADNKDKMLIGVGAGLGFAGAILFPTGLILAIKGGTNYNRDCRGSSGQPGGSTLYIRPTGNGINMALKF